MIANNKHKVLILQGEISTYRVATFNIIADYFDLTVGYYVLVNYKADTSFVAELERNFNISEDIMRSMTVKVA